MGRKPAVRSAPRQIVSGVRPRLGRFWQRRFIPRGTTIVLSPRLAAVIIAAAAAIGLVLQFDATFAHVRSPERTLWILVDYFTVLANFAVALVFAGIAVGREGHSRLMAGLTLCILLVGVVYALMLRPFDHPRGVAGAANFVLHYVTPILVLLFWCAYVRKGGLRARDPLVFVVVPLLYLVYVLVRGAIEGRYPYPFLNVPRIGLVATLVNTARIGLGFILAGYVLFLADLWLSRGGKGRR